MMDTRAYVLEALHALELDQAGLARRLGRSPATVSRWLSGDSTPDYESCLRLARILGVPPRRIVQAAGLDPLLVPDDGAEPQLALDPRLAAFIAAIEKGWLAMESPEQLEIAERGTLALFRVEDVRRRPRPPSVTTSPQGFDRDKSEDVQHVPPVRRPRRRYESQSLDTMEKQYGRQPLVA